MRLLLDTNIYGWALEKEEIADLLAFFAEKKQTKEIIVLGSEIINKEINANPYREARERMKELYQAVISGEVRLTESVDSLANIYFNGCREKGIKITLEDCSIVSSASLAAIDLIITDNRSTMSNPKSIEIFDSINRKRKLKTIKFMNSNEAIKMFFSKRGNRAIS